MVIVNMLEVAGTHGYEYIHMAKILPGELLGKTIFYERLRADSAKTEK